MSEIEQIKKIVNDLVLYNNSQNNNNINIQDICIGEVIQADGKCGCLEGNDGWYFYSVCDCDDLSFIGPFNALGVVKAIATHLHMSSNLEFLKFTQEEKYIYVYNTMTDDEFFKKKNK